MITQGSGWQVGTMEAVVACVVWIDDRVSWKYRTIALTMMLDKMK